MLKPRVFTFMGNLPCPQRARQSFVEKPRKIGTIRVQSLDQPKNGRVEPLNELRQRLLLYGLLFVAPAPIVLIIEIVILLSGSP
jgi:hypothetical protein